VELDLVEEHQDRLPAAGANSAGVGRNGMYGDPGAVGAVRLVDHLARREREKGVISTHPDSGAS
jgi:hypothetical protein